MSRHLAERALEIAGGIGGLSAAGRFFGFLGAVVLERETRSTRDYFARDWMLENKDNQTSFKATRAKLAAHPIEEVGEKLRDMMPWIKNGALVDKTKN